MAVFYSNQRIKKKISNDKRIMRTQNIKNNSYFKRISEKKEYCIIRFKRLNKIPNMTHKLKSWRAGGTKLTLVA